MTNSIHPARRNETCQERAARECSAGGGPPAANFNRASAGFTADTLVAMLAGLDSAGLYFADVANRSSDTYIGHRHNHVAEHGARIEAAAKRLRSYGLRVRVARRGGKLRGLTVYGPKAGGSDGQYSA